MKASLLRRISTILVVSMLALPFHQAAAEMVATEQALAAAPAVAGATHQAASRADVAQQLQALGVEPAFATQRLDAMSDEEVQKLAAQLDTLPAGASSGWWWAAGVLAVAAIIWYLYAYK